MRLLGVPVWSLASPRGADTKHQTAQVLEKTPLPLVPVRYLSVCVLGAISVSISVIMSSGLKKDSRPQMVMLRARARIICVAYPRVPARHRRSAGGGARGAGRPAAPLAASGPPPHCGEGAFS